MRRPILRSIFRRVARRLDLKSRFVLALAGSDQAPLVGADGVPMAILSGVTLACRVRMGTVFPAAQVTV
jgi:hypothetical protein